jgi:hypothetical protein
MGTVKLHGYIFCINSKEEKKQENEKTRPQNRFGEYLWLPVTQVH